ncbi:hypothetical protein OROGR_026229 [Orobanche gracilis]
MLNVSRYVIQDSSKAACLGVEFSRHNVTLIAHTI